MNFKFLVIKAPDQYHINYSCGGLDPCECVNLPILTDIRLGHCVVPVDLDHPQWLKHYEYLKSKGFIQHETEDSETAQAIAMDLLRQYEKDNDDVNLNGIFDND